MLGVASIAHAQFTITELNGGPFAANLSTQGGASAFAKDLIAGGAYPQHTIPHLNDNTFGNSNSWIGDTPTSFAGISLGATPISVGRIAFGRDNTATYFDRTAGIYTIQYTTVANPNASTLDASWTTLGTITHAGGGPSLISTSRRHAWNFTPVLATGFRIQTPDGACIDELELAPFAPAPFTLQATGGTMGAGNIALGGVAFAFDVLPGYAAHSIPHLNDGIYGNANSWIGNSADSFAGVSFASAQTIDHLAFGRDNSPFYTDRAEGTYLVQYTTVPGANETTPDASWTNIGALNIDPADPNRALRHEYSFDPVAGATALRIVAPTGAAIDELEVYVVPEPGSAMTLLIGAAALGLRRRKA